MHPDMALDVEQQTITTIIRVRAFALWEGYLVSRHIKQLMPDMGFRGAQWDENIKPLNIKEIRSFDPTHPNLRLVHSLNMRISKSFLNTHKTPH